MPRKLAFFLRAVFSLLLLWVVLQKIEWVRLAEVLARSRWEFAALAFSLLPLLVFLLALRWQIFLRQQNLFLPMGSVFVTTWAGQFFNTFLPGSTGGDLVKIVQVCRWCPQKKSSGVASIFLDRLSALLALLVFVVFSIFRQPIPCEKFGISQSAGWVVLLAAGVLGCGALALLIRYSERLRTQVVHVLAAAETAFSSKRSMAAGVAMAFVVHSVSFLFFYLSAHAVGLNITFGQAMMICPVVILLTMLPLTVNGHGVREVILISYFSVLQFSPPDGIAESVVALSIISISMDFLWNLPGGLFYIFGFNKNPVKP